MQNDFANPGKWVPAGGPLGRLNRSRLIQLWPSWPCGHCRDHWTPSPHLGDLAGPRGALPGHPWSLGRHRHKPQQAATATTTTSKVSMGCHIVSGLSHIVSMRQCQYWTHLYSNTGAHTHTSPLTTIPPTGYGPQRTTARIQQSSTHAQLHIWFEIGWHLRHQCRVYIIQLYSETPTREKHL